DLDPGGPASSDDEGQELPLKDRIRFDDGPLDAPDHMVANRHGIVDRSQWKAEGLESRLVEKEGHAAEGDDQIAVPNRHVLGVHGTGVQVESCNFGLEKMESHFLGNGPKWVAHVGCPERACCDLGEQWSEREVVPPID